MFKQRLHDQKLRSKGYFFRRQRYRQNFKDIESEKNDDVILTLNWNSSEMKNLNY